MRECHAWMNATIKHDKRWIAKSLEVGPITGRPSGVCRHENGKPIGGKLAFNGTKSNALRRWPVAWVDRLRDSILLDSLWFRCDWFRWFSLRFTIANAISCTICPWSLGDGWPNGWLGLGWMAGFLLGRLEHVPPEPWGARTQCSHTSLWRIHLGTSLRGASLNHDRFVDVSGMIKKSHLGRSQNPVKNPKGVGRAILIGASHAKWQLRPRSS